MRILLTRLDRVGDLLLSTPAIATIRRAFPAARITLACSAYNAIVVERSPDVDAIERIGDRDDLRAVAARHPDLALALALAPRARDLRLVGLTGARRRIGYTYASRALTRLWARGRLTDLLLSVADPAGADRDPSRFVPHEVDQVLALAVRAGATALARDLVLPLTEADRAAVADLPAASITVQLGRRWGERGSTLDALVGTLAALRALGRPIVCTYAADGEAAAAAVRAAGVADRVVGGLPFFAWAAAFERAAVVLTIDTGATHVASAMRRPTVVLYEHQHYRLASREWSPYRVPNRVLRKPARATPAALAASRAEIVAAVASLLE